MYQYVSNQLITVTSQCRVCQHEEQGQVTSTVQQNTVPYSKTQYSKAKHMQHRVSEM